MQFNTIRGLVLANVRKYSTSPKTNTVTIVEGDINLAIKALVKYIETAKITLTENKTTTDRSSSLSPTYTMSVTSVDEIVKMRYTYDADEWDIDRVNRRSLRQRISDLSGTGRPSVYLPKGNTAGKPKFDFYPITAYANETIEIQYKPILTDLSGTSENIMTIRYPFEIIEIATKFARRNLTGQKVSEEKMMDFVLGIANRINAKEQSPMDYRYNQLPPAVLIARRKNRRTI